MSEKLVCPRREESSVSSKAFKYPKSDKWEVHKQLMADKPNTSKLRQCSYCGSIHPDDFLKCIDEGWTVGPTDKNYKVYIQKEGSETNIAGINVPEILEHGKFYFQHFNEDHKHKFIDILNNKKIKIGYPGRFYVLPFFIK